MGGNFIRTIGLARAKLKIGLMNLTYNLMRYLQLTKGRESTLVLGEPFAEVLFDEPDIFGGEIHGIGNAVDIRPSIPRPLTGYRRRISLKHYRSLIRDTCI